MPKTNCPEEELGAPVLMKYFLHGKPEEATYHIAIPRSTDPEQAERDAKLMGDSAAYIFYPDNLTFFKTEEEARKYGKRHGFEMGKVIERDVELKTKAMPKKELPEVPVFKTYENACSWLNKAARHYGRDSDNYRKLYETAKPQIQPLKKLAKQERVKKLTAELKEEGLKIGDKVSYFSMSFTGLGGMTYKGTLILRGSIPTVQLDQSSATASGRKFVEWNKSWTREK